MVSLIPALHLQSTRINTSIYQIMTPPTTLTSPSVVVIIMMVLWRNPHPPLSTLPSSSPSPAPSPHLITFTFMSLTKPRSSDHRQFGEVKSPFPAFPASQRPNISSTTCHILYSTRYPALNTTEHPIEPHALETSELRTRFHHGTSPPE